MFVGFMKLGGKVENDEIIVFCYVPKFVGICYIESHCWDKKYLLKAQLIISVE